MNVLRLRALPVAAGPIPEVGSYRALRDEYDDYVRDVEYFLTWRRWLMSFWLGGSTALGTVSAWMYDRGLHLFTPWPLYLAAMWSFAAIALEMRNNAILCLQYQKAGEVADLLGMRRGGSLGTIIATRGWKGRRTYFFIFSTMRAVMGTVFLVAAISFTHL